MTDKERSAMSLKTTAGFKHHKLNVCIQSPEAFPKGHRQHNYFVEDLSKILKATEISKTQENK